MKLKVHLIDDKDLSNEIKRRLVEKSGKLNDDKARIELSKQIFDFRYFSRVDEVLAYYEQKGETFYPDLIVIDLSFDGLENTGHSFSFLCTWGIEVGDYANINFPASPRIFLTGNANNPDVLEQLKKKNIKIDDLDMIRKGEENHLKERFETLLRRRAKYLLNLLNENQRSKLWKKITKGVNLVQDKEVNVLNWGLRKISLRSLLWGFGDIELMSAHEVNKLVGDILQEIGKDIQFSGEWKKKDSHVRKVLHKYQESDEYEDTKRSIDIRALNLLLEILQIRSYYIDNDNEDEIPLYKNFVKQLCVVCKDDIEEQIIFEQKMIGRRVVLGFYSLYENGDTRFELDILCSLLKRGITVDETNPAPIDSGNIVNTALGLMSRNGRLILNRQTMLFEEEEWVRNFGKYAVRIRAFLDKYSIRDFDGAHNDNFIDIHDVSSAIRSVRTNASIRRYAEFVKHMKETIDDNDQQLLPIMEDLLGLQLE